MLRRIGMAVLLAMMLAVPAHAELNGVYGGIKVIDSYQSQWGGGVLNDSRSSNTFGAGLLVGYDFYMQSDTPVRAEIEYAFRSAFKGEDNSNLFGTNYQADVEFNVQTLMASAFYDFYTDSIFTPYVGGGLGVAFVDGSVDLSSNGLGSSRNLSDSVFAWHVGGGVGVAINERISADVGYRYLNLDTVKGDFHGNNMDIDISAHEFSVGLRFAF